MSAPDVKLERVSRSFFHFVTPSGMSIPVSRGVGKRVSEDAARAKARAILAARAALK